MILTTLLIGVKLLDTETKQTDSQGDPLKTVALHLLPVHQELLKFYAAQHRKMWLQCFTPSQCFQRKPEHWKQFHGV